MLRITLTKDGELPQVSTFDTREITIGRTSSNDLVIPEPGVSSSHARLLSTGDGLTLIDLESTNGTFVNGERIRGPSLVQPGDEVYICAYRLDFELNAGGAAAGPTPQGPPSVGDPKVEPPPAVGGGRTPYPTAAEPPRVAPPGPDSGPAPIAAGPPPMLDGPPRVDPPPVAPSSVDPSSVAPSSVDPPLDPPPSTGVPPPPLLAPPAPIGKPTRADEPAAPPPVGAPDAPPELVRPVGVSEPPSAMPPPIGGPEPAAPPPVTPPSAVPPPVGIAPPPAVGQEPPTDERSTSVVSGLISAPDDVPDVTPRAAATPERTPLDGTPIAPVHTPVDPAPVTPQPIDPMTATARPTPPSDDLSDLSGPDAAKEACARVFALVHYALAPEGGLPARDAPTRARARREAGRWLARAAHHVPEVQARPWANRMANELCGLGALSGPLAEPDVTELYVHGPRRVLVRRSGEAPTTIDARFSCPAAVELVVRRLTGRPFGPDAPVVEARSADGAEVRAVHGSMASPGPLVTIHRSAVETTARGLETLVQGRALSSGIATLLHHCVRAGLNILVCGGPGASTFGWLAALTAEVPESERVVVVSPGPESDPLPDHALVVHTGTSPSLDGLSGPRWAVRGALNLAPDRLVVHDVAGPEATDVVAAMGRGLSGTLCSVRAGSAEDGLARLIALAGLAGDCPDASARAQHVAQSIEVVIAVSRFPDGHIRVTSLAEATVTDEGTPRTVELVTYRASTGQWASTGITPAFFAEMQRRGIAVDVGLLDE